MTTTERTPASGKRRPLAPAARRAAARMVLAADKAAGRDIDPRMAPAAEGCDKADWHGHVTEVKK